jgi:tRNA nucleotidyltransferase/poly(A) polymerase
MAKQALGLKTVNGARIAIELQKVLTAKKPSIYFNILKDLELLEVVHPELHKLTEINIAYGENAFQNAMRAVDNSWGHFVPTISRFAALYYNLGWIKVRKYVYYRHLNVSRCIVPSDILALNYGFNLMKASGFPKGWIPLAKKTAEFGPVIKKFKKLNAKSLFMRIAKGNDYETTLPKDFNFKLRDMFYAVNACVLATNRQSKFNKKHEDLFVKIYDEAVNVRIAFPGNLLETPMKIEPFKDEKRIEAIAHLLANNK